MLGSIITEPVTADSSFGVLSLHPSGRFDGCGDSTFATAAAALETGLVPITEPTTHFSMDSVLGPLRIEADVSGGIVTQVRFSNVPSYYVGSMCAELAGCTVRIEVAFGGLYYGFVDAADLDIRVNASAERQIVAAAQGLWNSVGDSIPLKDPVTGKSARLDLFTFVEPAAESTDSIYVVANVYPPASMGRTPSGTGTSAHMALRAAQGVYDPDRPFVQTGVLGLSFTGRATRRTLGNGVEGLEPIIGAKSYMMGTHQFMIDPADPFARGFIFNS